MILIYIHSTEPFQFKRIDLNEMESDVIVLVPAQDVLLTNVTLPKLNRQRLLAALPFALEEQLIDDVNQLHFAPGEHQADQSLPVAVVSQQKMNFWMHQLNQAGITPTMMIPATLALPFTPDNWQISIDNATAIVRTGKYSGFACEKDNLTTMLTLKLSEIQKKPECIHIHNLSNQPLNLSLPDISINEIRVAEQPFLEDVAQTIKQNITINLLQGIYRPKIKASQTKIVWLAAIVLAISWFGLTLLGNFVSLFILHHANNQFEQAINKIYFRQFPKATSVVAPHNRIEEKLKQLSAQSQKNIFFNLLGLVGKNLSQVNNIHLLGLEFNEDQINLSIAADTFNSLDQFNQMLLHQGLKVIQKNAGIVDKQVRANLFIQAGNS